MANVSLSSSPAGFVVFNKTVLKWPDFLAMCKTRSWHSCRQLTQGSWGEEPQEAVESRALRLWHELPQFEDARKANEYIEGYLEARGGSGANVQQQ